MNANSVMTIENYVTYMGKTDFAMINADLVRETWKAPAMKNIKHVEIVGKRIGNVVETIRIERPETK